MSEKVAVYICECGDNIKTCLDIEELKNYSLKLNNVFSVKVIPFLCSKDECRMLTDDIKKNQFDRLVIAGCSPREHEQTFMKVAYDAGLNPYLIQIANIREHCAWVVKDKAEATVKAQKIIRRAVKRVLQHKPLENREIECNTDVLVIGAGVAGIEAALTVARSGRKVYFVEKTPYIGGSVAGYESVFSGMECASCMLSPKLEEVIQHDNIELYTYSEISEVKGFLGNFTVEIRKKARSVIFDNCIGCNACINTCPVIVDNEYENNLSKRKAIYIPFAGTLPNVPVLDRENCLNFSSGKECELCKNECMFGAIDLQQKDEMSEVKVGGIILATGFDMFKPDMLSNLGYNRFDNVFSAVEFSRILNEDGPTNGNIVLKDGSVPETVAVIFCVGSRNKNYLPYCSGICCMYSLAFMRLAKKKNPDIQIVGFYSDLVLDGLASQEFYNEIVELGVRFIRVDDTNGLNINNGNRKLTVEFKDEDKVKNLNFDMVVLSQGLIPGQDTEFFADIFDVPLNKYGFVEQEHQKLLPVNTMVEGIYAAGCCLSPKNIQTSVAQGGAAAGKLLSILVPGKKLLLETMTSEIISDSCSGCKLCISLCPYKAISYNEKMGVSEINEVLCRGCGVCVVSCPSGAIKAKHFTEEMILTEIEEILK